MGISGNSNLARAQAEYDAAFQAVFAGGADSTIGLWVAVKPSSGTSYEIPVLTAFPRIRQWLGPRQTKDLRAYRLNIPVKSWEASLELPRITVQYDKNGVVGDTLTTFMQQNASIMEDLLTSSSLGGLLSNPTGYDGVSLIHDTHPNTGGNADNSADAQLSFPTYRTGREAMRDVADEDGRLLGMRPTHLMVGPELERTALEVVGDVRPIPVANNGTFETGTIVGGVALPNVFRGTSDVIVNDYITDDSFVMMDLSKPGIRPMLWIDNRRVTPAEQTQLTDAPRMQADVYIYGLELDGAQGAGPWQCCWGEFNPS